MVVAAPRARKAPKTREQLEAQVRLSLPDVLQWFGWPRRTWDKTWKARFPAPLMLLDDRKYWATSQVLEWEAQFAPKQKAAQ